MTELLKTGIRERTDGFLAALAGWAGEMPALPARAEREARLSLIDTLACVLAGAREHQTTGALAALRAERMSGPSRSVVAGTRLPVAAAALLNGVAAHALDYDDYEIPGSTHPSAVLVPALLAMAEAKPVTLAQVTRAYIAGYECICRLGEALGYGHYERGWHATGTLGPIGGALSVAHLSGLSSGATVSAMSLAASMSAGLQRQFGSDAKAVHAGLAARAGVEAAMLARAGLTASPHVIEGPHGFVALYGTSTSPGAVAGMAHLGRPLAIVRHPPLRKPWPCCAYTHRAIAAAIAVASRPGFDPDRIGEADLRIPEPYSSVAGFTDPRSPSEARFSVIYCVAAALRDRAITPASFSAEALKRPEIRALIARIALRPYALAPGLGDMNPDAPDSLTVRMEDGTVLCETVAEVPGAAARPLGTHEILRKFETCGGDRRAAETVLSAPGATPFRWSDFSRASAAAAKTCNA